MTRTATLSVGMPNYNHAKFLPAALESVLNQSLQPLEIIVIDDASTDDSMSVLSMYEGKVSNLRVIRNERNLGVVETLNRLTNLAQGDYVYLPAADDVLLPGILEKSMGILTRHPQAGLCSALTRIIDESGADRGVPFPSLFPGKEPRYLGAEQVLSQLLLTPSWIGGNTAVYRRDALIEAGGFRPELGPFADGFVQHVLALKYGSCFIPEPLHAWRRTATQYSAAHYDNNGAAARRIFDVTRRLMLTEFSHLFTPELVQRWSLRWMYTQWTSLAAAKRQDLLSAMEILFAATGPVERGLSALFAALTRLFFAFLGLLAGLTLRRHDLWSWAIRGARARHSRLLSRRG
jgi:glycosyltransferase involved in cell wall biosynthesis